MLLLVVVVLRGRWLGPCSGLMVSDGGTKFRQEWMCFTCGEYELDEAPGGTPQGVEMQRS